MPFYAFQAFQPITNSLPHDLRSTQVQLFDRYVQEQARSKACSDFEFAAAKGVGISLTRYIGRKKHVCLPFQINGLPVTEIGEKAFYQSGVCAVTIPDSVTSVGKHAFARCKDLTDVIGARKVSSMGALAFYETPWHFGQAQKHGMVVAGSVLSDGYFCEGDVVVPEKVKCIADGAFDFRLCPEDGLAIKSVCLPDGLTGIGDYAFAACHGITSIAIPPSVIRIGDAAFIGCAKLSNVTLPDRLMPSCRDAFGHTPWQRQAMQRHNQDANGYRL